MEKRTSAVRIALIALLLAMPAGASGASTESGAEEKVHWSARFDPPVARPGQEPRLLVEARIAPGWHTYSITQPPGGPKPTQIRVEEAPGLEPLGPFRGPQPERTLDPAFQMVVESHSGSIQFERRWRVSPAAQAGTVRVRGTAEAMLCDSTMCLPPRRWPFEAEIQVLAPGSQAASGAAGRLAPSPPPASATAPAPSPAVSPRVAGPGRMSGPLAPLAPPSVKSLGLLAFILAAVGAGFAALLTPCVFPMVPITISFFTKQSGRTSWQALWKAGLYSLSIVGSFLVLGLLLSAVSGASGANRFAANPWVNLAIAALFMVFALSLFGAFEIRIPAEWLNRLGLAANSGGPLGIVMMGFVFTVTSFTCTVGFVGFVLVMASQGDWLWPAVGMFFFSAAFSLPFFFLALFPQWLTRLPKSGAWLNSVKVVMGLLELAFAFKFLSNVDLFWSWGVFTRPVLLAAWTAVAAAVGLYLLGLFRLRHDGPTQGLGPTRLLLALFFLTFSLYLSRGLFGMPINGKIEAFLPPPPFRVATEGGEPPAPGPGEKELAWFDNYQQALAAAREQGKPLFIDFTGIYCSNCRLMENEMFTRPEIKAELERFVRARLYTDKAAPESQAYQQMQVARYGSAALPFYAIVNPKDESAIATFAGMTWDSHGFRQFLRSGFSERP